MSRMKHWMFETNHPSTWVAGDGGGLVRPKPEMVEAKPSMWDIVLRKAGVLADSVADATIAGAAKVGSTVLKLKGENND